jgi:hypothetical protein
MPKKKACFSWKKRAFFLRCGKGIGKLAKKNGEFCNKMSKGACKMCKRRI